MIDKSSLLDNLYTRRQDFFFRRSPFIFLILGLFFLTGMGYFLYGFSDDPQRAWGTLLCNNLFFFLLSLGGIVFGLIQDACGAQWSRPIKRFHESFAIFFYLSCLIFIAFLGAIKFRFMEAHKVFSWIENPEMLDHFPGKNQWLVEDFFLLRVVFLLVVMSLIVFWAQWQNSLADKPFLAGKLEEARRVALRAHDRLQFWSSPCLFALGVLFTFVVIDLVMSLAPLWFSTLWAGWLFSILMQVLLSVMLVAMFMIKKRPVGSLISRSQFHDMGKLLHGFSAFWAYLTFAHVLTYWYGNVPEETEYFLHRLHQPWQTMMIVIMFLAFIIPFFVLIPKASKWTSWIMVPLAFLIVSAQWLAHVVMVQPEVVSHASAFPSLELSGFIIFSALFVAVFYHWGTRHLMVSLHDPLLEKYLQKS